MNNKNLFHKMTIKIPSELIYINKKNGNIKLVPTLTKTGGLTKRDGEPSIILKKDNYIIHPEIENIGAAENYDELKAKNKKPRAPRKKKEKQPEQVEEEKPKKTKKKKEPEPELEPELEPESDEDEDEEEDDKEEEEDNFNINKYNFDNRMKMKLEVIKLMPEEIISYNKRDKIFKQIDDGSIKTLSKLNKILDSIKEKFVRKRPRDIQSIKHLNGYAKDITNKNSFEQKFLLNAIINKDVVNHIELANLRDELDMLINNSDNES